MFCQRLFVYEIRSTRKQGILIFFLSIIIIHDNLAYYYISITQLDILLSHSEFISLNRL